jgi:hypothetical protein
LYFALCGTADFYPADTVTIPTSIPFTTEGMIEATTSRVVKTTLDEAWRQVLSEVPGLSEDDRALAWSTDSVVKPPGAYVPGFDLTEKRRVVAVQGGWWYRGVTSVEVHPEGALVTHTVVNVAPGWGKWLAHFVQARQVRRTLSAHPSKG